MSSQLPGYLLSSTENLNRVRPTPSYLQSSNSRLSTGHEECTRRRERGDYAPAGGRYHRTKAQRISSLDFPEGLAICRSVEQAVSRIGEASVSVTKSQVAFRRRKGFAYVWRPGQYVHSEVPTVLSIALPHEVRCHRFKEVVHPSANVWMHHLELHAASQIDDQVRGWLEEAYANAG